MNPIHLDYIKRPSHNDFDELFGIIDTLDPKKRDEAMMYTFMQFVKMERTPDAGPHDRIGDTLTDYTNYNRFKKECHELPESLSAPFVVNGIVFFTLSYCCGRAEMDKEETVKWHIEVIQRAQAKLATVKNEVEKNSFREGAEISQRKIDNIDNEIREAKEIYAYICENLVRPLMEKWAAKQRQFFGR